MCCRKKDYNIETTPTPRQKDVLHISVHTGFVKKKRSSETKPFYTEKRENNNNQYSFRPAFPSKNKVLRRL